MGAELKVGFAYHVCTNNGQHPGIPHKSSFFSVHGTDEKYATLPETRYGNSFEVVRCNSIPKVESDVVVGRLVLESGDPYVGRVHLTPARMTSKQVQTMIEADDNEVLCHGCDHNNNTVEIWFENGYLVLCTENEGFDGADRIEKRRLFEPFWFINVKRWYVKRGFNVALQGYLDTFGTNLPLYHG